MNVVAQSGADSQNPSWWTSLVQQAFFVDHVELDLWVPFQKLNYWA